MTKVRTALLSAIAIGLLAGSTLGVAAQDGAAAPAEFTAEWGFDAFGCCSIVEPATDPRFVGDVSVTFGSDDYPAAGGLRVITRAFHLENEEGIWRGVPQQHLQFPDGTAAGTTQTFIGERGYAGHYAVVDITTTPGAGGGVELHGYIIEGEPPSAS